MSKYKRSIAVTVVLTVIWVVIYWQVGYIRLFTEIYQRYGMGRPDLIVSAAIWLGLAACYEHGLAVCISLLIWAGVCGREFDKNLPDTERTR